MLGHRHQPGPDGPRRRRPVPQLRVVRTAPSPAPLSPVGESARSLTAGSRAIPSTAASLGTCTGTPFTNITNTPINGGTGATSVAYRLFCQHGPSSTPDTSQITDWGQLTNLGGAAVGDGTPIGVPVRIIGINNGSGTVSTFYNFAQSGIGTPAAGEPSTDCAGGSGTVSSSDVDQDAASGQDPDNNQGPAGSNFIQNTEISLENDPQPDRRLRDSPTGGPSSRGVRMRPTRPWISPRRSIP